jgi:glycosyltransferase involved in cell wall biosynthesis
MKKTAGYLSGAPRVSTNESSVSSGARAHILGVINGLKDNGLEVKEFIFGDILSKNLQQHDFYKPTKRNFYKRIVADLIRIFLNYLNQIKARKSIGQVDFVYERLGAFQTLGMLFKRKGITWILETNSIIHLEADKDRKSIFFVGICKFFERKAYEEADYIVCITNELKKMVIETFSISEDKIIVIPNGVDTSRFDPELYKTKSKEKVIFGFVGNLIPWAGIDILIHAVHKLKDKSDLRVLIIGDGQCRDEWEQLTKVFNLEHIITFAGRKPWSEIPEEIAGFDFCYSGQINTSADGMYHSPLKIYEYLSMGKPVIASAYQDAENLIENGINGYKFSPGSVDELYEVMMKCLNEKERFKSVSIHIRNQILNKHSWTRRVEDLLNNIDLSKYADKV